MDDDPSPPPAPAVPAAPKTSKLAVVSLVLGLSGLLFWCLTGLPGAICGHVAMAKIRKSGGALTGEGIALAGVIAGYITTALSVLVVPIVAALTVPVFAKIDDRAETQKAINHARQIYLGCKLYTFDSDGHYPESLEQLVEAGITMDTDIFYPVGDHRELAPTDYLFRLVHPGANESELPPDAPVIVSVAPVSRSEQWVVVTNDGGVKALTPTQFERLGIGEPESQGGDDG